ncbi:hypothetical protein QCA50_020216 [Cerrena zonata]|uniref:Protein kinase domain-containing protein n=1 Tax=Cerrena zonata TaxID=2478898 RepID=A0AAW0FJJ2_9APHY
MAGPSSNHYLTLVEPDLRERRDAWKILDLHLWFDVSAECHNISRHLDDTRVRMQEEGYEEGDIQLALGAYLEGVTTTVRGHTGTLRAININVENERRDILLTQILSDTFLGPHATIKDPTGGFVHLLGLAAEGSEIHKNLVVSFRGPAADYVLSMMTQRNLDGLHGNPLTPLWKAHRPNMLRVLLKLARRSQLIPDSLFLNDVQCTQRDDPIGSGGNAEVFLATYQGKPVVLKRLRAFQNLREGRENVKEFCREALVWSHLSHPFIQSFLGVDNATFSGRHCMVTNWMENGNIHDCMNMLSSTHQQIPYDRWVLELCLGLKYLHQEQVIHGDIRGNNILIDNDLHIHITDFGLAAYAASTTTSVGAVGGSRRWMAPELFDPDVSGVPTFESDVYAFSMTCIEIYTREKPFPNIPNEYQVTTRVLRGERPPRPTHETGKYMSDALWETIQLCWASEHSDRPHISEVLDRVRPSLPKMISSSESSTSTAITSPPEMFDIHEIRRRHPTIVPLLSWIPSLLLTIYIIQWIIHFPPKHSSDIIAGTIIFLRPVQISLIVQFCFARAFVNCIRQFSGWTIKKEAIRILCASLLLSFGGAVTMFVAVAPPDVHLLWGMIHALSLCSSIIVGMFVGVLFFTPNPSRRGAIHL